MPPLVHMLHRREADYLRWALAHPIASDETVDRHLPTVGTGDHTRRRIAFYSYAEPGGRGARCRGCGELILPAERAIRFTFEPVSGWSRRGWLHLAPCHPDHAPAEPAYSRTPVV